MSDAPRVEVLSIEAGATPDPNNVNKHTQRGGGLLENSLRKRGAFRSIASAGKGAEVPTVYAGNYTLEKAIDAGFTEVVNVHVTGNQLVNVVRDDIAPGSPEAVALGIEDNEIGKQSYNPDIDILAALAAGDSALLAALRDEDRIFDGLVEGVDVLAYGDTSTERDGQGVSSAWNQVNDAEFDVMKLGGLEIRIPTATTKRFVDFCKLKYNTNGTPIFQTAVKILENGIEHENISD